MARACPSAWQQMLTARLAIKSYVIFSPASSPTRVSRLCSGIVGEVFFNNLFTPLGELFDILALINSAVNFILYCTMVSCLVRDTPTTFVRSLLPPSLLLTSPFLLVFLPMLANDIAADSSPSSFGRPSRNSSSCSAPHFSLSVQLV